MSAVASTPSGISPALQAQLDVLREAYASKLDEKIAQIEENWFLYLGFEEGMPRRETLTTLHRMTHTLAGSGATFGFPAISDGARRVEIILKSLLQSGAPLEDAHRVEIEAGLQALRDATRSPDSSLQLDNADGLGRTIKGRRKVFLFSDSPEGMPSWAPSLEAFGYSVQFFSRPADLQKAWRLETPSVIIADCQSEPLSCASDGTLLSSVITEALRDTDSPVPVVWTCRNGDLRSRLQAVRLGGTAFFAHPVDVDSLLVRLDDLTAYHAPEPFRVLIVDDEPSLGRLFSVVLRQAGMETLVVSDPMQIMSPLVDFRPDIILMDVYMPGCNGTEVASVIRQQEAYIGIPIMFLSTETDVTKQLAAMRQGGDDFLIKPVQPRHLVTAVTTRAIRARSIRNLMVRDSLTGLLNHTKIKEQLSIELDRAKRLGNTVSLVMLDIDKFKKVNDTYGHATGDRVLRSLARLLGQRLRQTDVIGRYGGEEFAVIMNGSSAEDARIKLEEVRTSFANLAHTADGEDFYVTFSAGVASSPPFADQTLLSEAADKALYEAKRSGRNRINLAESADLWTQRGPL